MKYGLAIPVLMQFYSLGLTQPVLWNSREPSRTLLVSTERVKLYRWTEAKHTATGLMRLIPQGVCYFYIFRDLLVLKY